MTTGHILLYCYGSFEYLGAVYDMNTRKISAVNTSHDWPTLTT